MDVVDLDGVRWSSVWLGGHPGRESEAETNVGLCAGGRGTFVGSGNSATGTVSALALKVPHTRESVEVALASGFVAFLVLVVGLLMETGGL